MRRARLRSLAYLARYAPGAPTPFLLTLSYDELTEFEAAVSALVGEEQKK